MARYEYTCEHDAMVLSAPMAEGPGEPPFCALCNGFMRRVYTVVIGNGVQLRNEREQGGARAVRDAFLPTAKDFASPTDPDGVAGLREWGDTHAPKNGNSKPLYPDIPKRSF